jgi:hypothetical protein
MLAENLGKQRKTGEKIEHVPRFFWEFLLMECQRNWILIQIQGFLSMEGVHLTEIQSKSTHATLARSSNASKICSATKR